MHSRVFNIVVCVCSYLPVFIFILFNVETRITYQEVFYTSKMQHRKSPNEVSNEQKQGHCKEYQ